MSTHSQSKASTSGNVWEVFTVFLRLGLTSFGGPVAHLGYFHEVFVRRRRWVNERAYADLVALCQLLPGPASSQVGMALGLQRAGYGGLVAAWVGFTLPSALLLFGFALGAPWLGRELGDGWITGLKAAAVAVVAHAVLGMARVLTPDAFRATIAAGTLALVLLFPGSLTQLLAMASAAVAGLLWLKQSAAVDPPDAAGHRSGSRSLAAGALVLFGALLVLLPVIASLGHSAVVQLADIFYRVGSLVFGGGHVVLPLLETEVVASGLVGEEMFLAGYGAAQAVPGPLFTFAAFLGALVPGSLPPAVGSLVALLAIFLPSALLVAGTLPFWDRLRQMPRVRQGLAGVNAAVVGLLAAALYSPVFIHGIPGTSAFVLAILCFVALTMWRAPAWAVALGAALFGGFFF
ncbi:chromate efflux transporter [Glutamicibacter sp. MNS18]|uniref:chromate efflux transporter n=1 Tax=Glutamicibacter sp. MNS18 TaxID=2989817 RepID=UPI002236228C|nr:chromate efflux transporter [Glutamicibacter sp. MNS18]MCW4465446.1 chromate efflux transporter [Glutamicibacter sp. MNS18]